MQLPSTPSSDGNNGHNNESQLLAVEIPQLDISKLENLKNDNRLDTPNNTFTTPSNSRKSLSSNPSVSSSDPNGSYKLVVPSYLLTNKTTPPAEAAKTIAHVKTTKSKVIILIFI